MNETTTPHEQGEEPQLWSIGQVAQHLGAASAGSARRTLSRWGVEAADYQRGANNRIQALYEAEQVRAAAAARPGRGARTDLHSEEP
ncbi:hypothetical protein ABZ635_22725 [Nocardiopsis sp. NPDC007018]|uniref:hypothetical protein n=1 Tax=Nocardiopsis sp. NPDC007018 TaxID=3155721 RepID=UPI0033E9331B